jgi:hypothetical protein
MMNANSDNSDNSDNFKDFFKDTTSNIIILVSATLFIIFYIILKSTDVNNEGGIIALQILSLISMITLIVSIVKKFIPKFESGEPSIFQIIVLFLLNSWEYTKSSIYYIFNFLIIFFVNLKDAMKEIIKSIIFPNGKVIAGGIGILGILATFGFLLYYFGVDINTDKIKQYGEVKKIIYSIFIFLLVLSVLYNILPKLYSSDSSPSYKSALLVAIIVLISMLLAGFFMKEIFKGNYRNYGMLLFNVLIFLAFIYLIYGIKKFFFDQKMPTMETYSTFEYFLYYYLFPICFFIGYILYYIYIYKKEKLSFTDFSDYRVIIFDVLSGIIMLYLIYQLIIKNLLSLTTDSSIFHFIQSVFKVIPCVFTASLEYLMKNPSTGILSLVISAIFIFLMTFLSGNTNSNSWYIILIYILGIIMFITGIIKVLLATTSLKDTKVFQLLQNTIFAIPCLFLLGIDNAFMSNKFGTISEFLFIVLMIFFIFFYNSITTAIIPDLYEKYILNDGKQIINDPITLSKYLLVRSYHDLFNFNGSQSDDDKNNPNKFDYKYGLSFWIYIDSFAPLNSELYDICCLGDGLMVKYNPVENALYFMYNGVTGKNIIYEQHQTRNKGKSIKETKKNKENFENKNLTIEELNRWNKYKIRQNKLNKFLMENNKFEGFKNYVEEINKEIIEEPKEIIIHKEFGVLLQRWNNIIINYHGGTLDIFINGEMINSKINVVPYISNTALTVGKNNGIRGDICNLIYYKFPMTKTDIYRMYHIFKNKNPPIINKSDTNVINLGETLEVYFSELLGKMDKVN